MSFQHIHLLMNDWQKVQSVHTHTHTHPHEHTLTHTNIPQREEKQTFHFLWPAYRLAYTILKREKEGGCGRWSRLEIRWLYGSNRRELFHCLLHKEHRGLLFWWKYTPGHSEGYNQWQWKEFQCLSLVCWTVESEWRDCEQRKNVTSLRYLSHMTVFVSCMPWAWNVFPSCSGERLWKSEQWGLWDLAGDWRVFLIALVCPVRMIV